MSEDALESWNRLVDESPDAAALYLSDGSAVSRKELDEKSDVLRINWLKEGLKPHRLLLLNLSNGVEWMVSFLACLQLKMIVVPLNSGIEEKEAMSLLKNLRAQVIWDGKILRKQGDAKTRVFRNKKVVLGKLTSGSTGKPKLLLFSDSEMVADGENIIRAMKILGKDVNLGSIPWGHSYGLGNIVYPLLIQGTGATWTDTPFPSEIADTCAMTKATVFPTIPTVLRALSRSDCDQEKFSSLKLVISAGARLEPEIAEGFWDRFGIVPRNFYGSTETGGICFDETGEAALSGRSVGKPFEGVRILETRGKRFYVEGEAVFRFGNRNAVEGLLSKHLVADYGYIDFRGELVLEKRAKGLLKIGGNRINPSDIESRLERLALVKEAIVFGVEIDQETVLATAVESTAPREDVMREIRRSLPKKMRPKKLICFEAFPATRSGKVNLGVIQKAFD